MFKSNFSSEEYSALLNENRYRFEYFDKLNSGFITFITAIFTISFGLFSVVMSKGSQMTILQAKIAEASSSKIVDFYQKQLNSYEICNIFLQFFQAFLLLTPILYSKICYHRALENGMLISLNSDYLQYVDKNQNNFLAIRRSNVGEYSFDGNLKKLHRTISFFSFIFGIIFGITVYINCIYSIQEDDGIKTYLQVLGYVFLILTVVSGVLHFCIVVLANKCGKKCNYQNYEDYTKKIAEQ